MKDVIEQLGFGFEPLSLNQLLQAASQRRDLSGRIGDVLRRRGGGGDQSPGDQRQEHELRGEHAHRHQAMSQVPEGVLDVELMDDEETLALRAEVAWSRRVAFGKHEAGLKFVDLPAEAPLQLSRIATRNRLRRVLDAA